MSQTETLAWVREWIDNWNRRDVEAVLAHFADDVEFTSPRAVPITGKASLTGKLALRDYWTRGMAAIQSIHFDLDYVIADGDRLGIIYTSEINGTRMRSVEFLRFNDAGLVCGGEAMHGAMLS
jgi:ketosteroid isomerase-like protein